MPPTRRNILGLAPGLAIGLAIGAVAPGLAAAGPINVEDGTALSGYDPVAYFTEGAPRAGDPAITAEWGGASWRFVSTANRDAFLAAPETFAPQFGGYCAWAVAEGSLAPIDPDAWSIVGGKLYLNYSSRIRRKWEGDIPGNIARAEANWPGLAR